MLSGVSNIAVTFAVDNLAQHRVALSGLQRADREHRRRAGSLQRQPR
jgi:hypothetical protein